MHDPMGTLRSRDPGSITTYSYYSCTLNQTQQICPCTHAHMDHRGAHVTARSPSDARPAVEVPPRGPAHLHHLVVDDDRTHKREHRAEEDHQHPGHHEAHRHGGSIDGHVPAGSSRGSAARWRPERERRAAGDPSGHTRRHDPGGAPSDGRRAAQCNRWLGVSGRVQTSLPRLPLWLYLYSVRHAPNTQKILGNVVL